MRISIAGKICFVLLMIFSSVLLGITTYQSRLEHDMMLQLSRNEAHHQMVEMLDKQSISRLTHQPMETQETRLREQTLEWLGHPLQIAGYKNSVYTLNRIILLE